MGYGIGLRTCGSSVSISDFKEVQVYSYVRSRCEISTLDFSVLAESLSNSTLIQTDPIGLIGDFSHR